MKFKLLSKETMGIALFLLFVVLVSQSRMFDFLLETTLGRALFLILLLVISYCYKILGVVSILLVVILFNNRHELYYEGFDTSDASGNMTDASGNMSSGPDKKKMIAAKQIKSNKQDASGNVAVEGFDILGTENTLKRGKKSNSIPVSTNARKSENVEPFYSSSLGSNSYSSF